MENHYWELIQQNANHIATINDELGQIVERLAKLETQLQLGVGILVALAAKALWDIFNSYKNNRK